MTIGAPSAMLIDIRQGVAAMAIRKLQIERRTNHARRLIAGAVAALLVLWAALEELWALL